MRVPPSLFVLIPDLGSNEEEEEKRSGKNDGGERGRWRFFFPLFLITLKRKGLKFLFCPSLAGTNGHATSMMEVNWNMPLWQEGSISSLEKG